MKKPVFAAACLAAIIGLSGCGAGGNTADWTQESLQTEGAAAIKTEFGDDVVLTCEGGLTNKQGNSIVCAGDNGQTYILSPTAKGELRVQENS